MYKVQPVFVGDVAGIAVDAGRLADNLVIDAVGPETFTFAELVSLIADRVGARTKVVSLAPGVALFPVPGRGLAGKGRGPDPRGSGGSHGRAALHGEPANREDPPVGLVDRSRGQHRHELRLGATPPLPVGVCA